MAMFEDLMALIARADSAEVAIEVKLNAPADPNAVKGADADTLKAALTSTVAKLEKDAV